MWEAAKNVVTRVGAVALMAISTTFLTSSTAEAQNWAFINSLGYGALGMGTGILVTHEADCTGGGFVCIPGELVVGTLGGLAIGGVTGAIIGRRANDAVGSGEPLSPSHRAAVTLGTASAGAMLGMAAAAILINPEGEGTFLGSDETTATLFSLVGAGSGLYYVGSRWDQLTGDAVRFRPALLEEGRPGVVARLRF